MASATQDTRALGQRYIRTVVNRRDDLRAAHWHRHHEGREWRQVCGRQERL